MFLVLDTILREDPVPYKIFFFVKLISSFVLPYLHFLSQFPNINQTSKFMTIVCLVNSFTLTFHKFYLI